MNRQSLDRPIWFFTGTGWVLPVRDVALDLFLIRVTLVSFFLAREASSRIEPTEIDGHEHDDLGINESTLYCKNR